jgi:hypothetical protein
MQYRHKALACLLFLHSLRSYSFLFSPSISLYMLICSSICMRAKHSCSLCLWSLPYHILSTRRLLMFFFLSRSILQLLLPLVLSFAYSSDSTLKKKGQRKGEKINSNRQKRERHIVLQSLSLIYYKEEVKIESTYITVSYRLIQCDCYPDHYSYHYCSFV